MGALGSRATADTAPSPFPSSRFQASPSAPPPPWRNARQDPLEMGGCAGQWAGRAVECRGRGGAAAEGWMGVGGGARVKVDWKR